MHPENAPYIHLMLDGMGKSVEIKEIKEIIIRHNLDLDPLILVGIDFSVIADTTFKIY